MMRYKIIFPSSPPNKSYEEALNLLKTYIAAEIVLPEPPSQSPFPYLYAPDELRLKYINDALLSKEPLFIIAGRGGYGILRIIDKIKFKRTNPKSFFMGFSDLTPLLLGLAKYSCATPIHGPTLIQLPSLSDIEGTFNLISKIIKGEPILFKNIEVIKGKKTTGRLIGGNLTMLCSILHTKFFPKLENNILFLEEVGEAPYRVDRLFAMLRLSGILNKLCGLILGDFSSENKEDEKLIKDIIYDYTRNLNYPVIINFPIGHKDKNYPLPIGWKCDINYDTIYIYKE